MPGLIPETQMKKKLPNVFAKWIRDTYDRCEEAFGKDTKPIYRDGRKIDYFEPERYMKNPEDVEKCELLLSRNFPHI